MEKIKASLLIIDDQEEMLSLCESVLGRIVTEVAVASSSKAARSAFRNKTFDLVLTDINIDADGDGIGLAQEIKNISPATSVVIMTATPTIDTAIGGLKTGALEYIIKPFPSEHLESVIRNTLEKARLSSELERTRAVKAELEAAYAQLRDADCVKDAFLSRINHELRTPLAIAITSSEILGRQFTDGESAEVWQRSDRALKNLHLVIDQLLLFSDLLKEDLKLKKTESDLWELLEAVVQELNPVFAEMQLKVSLSCEGDAYPVSADTELMRAVFKQILTNAVKFNNKGGAISVKASYAPDRVAFHFSDTGTGITDQAMPRVFDGFFQAADYLTRSVGGIGLGLATVKYIVEAHGGGVSVQKNVQGPGVTFLVFLPRGQGEK